SKFFDRKKNISLCGDGPEKPQELTEKKLSFSKINGLYFKFDEGRFGLDNIITNKECNTWPIGGFIFQLKYKDNVLNDGHAG
ncbi:14317_t:CDS:2, partial [Gigaspora rosea]